MFATASNCGAVIPCHNEAASIADVVQRTRAVLPIVIVVDDGSTDGSGDIASRAGARVLRIPARSGKGSSLAAGWFAASRAGLEWVLMLDGDGQHRPEESTALLATAASDRLLIVGNRLHAPEAMPLVRRATNRWMSRHLARLTGCPLPDSQCGFRLAHLPTLLLLGLTAAHFEIESEMCVAFAGAGLMITFVNVTPVYGMEHSKIHPLRDSWRWMLWLHRTRRSLRCRGLDTVQSATLGPFIPA